MTLNEPLGVIFQKIELFITTAVRTSNCTRNFPTCMELVASVPCSQEFTVGVYRGPVQFILCLEAVSKKWYKFRALMTVLDNPEAGNPTLVGCRRPSLLSFA
jgi:hypothetical protein